MLIGIGNSAREDDGLGWLFLNRIEAQYIGLLDIQYRFQLNLEDAELISFYSKVLFIDACKDPLPNGFSVEPCMEKKVVEYTSHLLSPFAILNLCNSLFGHQPKAAILAIQGYQWEFKEGLSCQALRNVAKAVDWFSKSYVNAKLFS